ncbi:hypothetical protein BCL90_0597 [Pedobacter alluvionis]|uniref:Uncharacterized protein n=1 Tax=Pedobacter alluvionis TaxID=475253 RepID=A0A497YAK8_9SPHI|nr:hypothetical protein BCL90_0597 [Pedobacter alluvionis]
MERFEKRDLHICFENHFVSLPDDEYRYLEGTALFFRFL